MRQKSFERLTWTGIVAALSPRSSLVSASASARGFEPRHNPDHSTTKLALTVRVVDQPTHDTVTIEWGDSTSGRYGHQLWRLGKATREGYCALSGNLVIKGQSIYRPRQGRDRPRNGRAIISASIVFALLSQMNQSKTPNVLTSTKV
jgi:hypothetical protein